VHPVTLQDQVMVIPHNCRMGQVIVNIVLFKAVRQVPKVIVVNFHCFLTLGTLRRGGFVATESVTR